MSPQFSYSDLLPLGEDSTKYRLLTKDGVSVKKHGANSFRLTFLMEDYGKFVDKGVRGKEPQQRR